MNIVKEYHETIEQKGKLKHPRSRRYTKLEDRATDLMTKILQECVREDNEKRRVG